ncbi:MAG: RluA family pseudouridine synthase [Candidatus Wallbacteria bacterium]|nr:RluA family pseudouridine synthase [Candidatus Wallbacteria bacterium]
MSGQEWYEFAYEGTDGLRLDYYLRARFRPFSRSVWSRRVADGLVLVNGRQVPPARRMHPGDRLAIAPEAAGPPPATGGIEVVYEDEAVVAVCKASGILVHPVRLMTRDTVLGFLSERWPGILPCHRLDKLTSGLVLAAKDLKARRAVQECFETGAVEKEYLALVEGDPGGEEGRVDAPIGRDPASAVRIRMCVREGGDACVTGWRVLERLPGHTLLSVVPETGRKHQIRVHLAHAGHPIHGDFLYGADLDVDYFENKAVNLTRDHERWIALHALALSLPHPARPGETLRLRAEAPARLRELLDALRAGCDGCDKAPRQ